MSTLDITHPDLVKQWHPTRNADIKPNKVGKGSNKKVWWLCDKNACPNKCKHEWRASIVQRTKQKASGCPYCSGRNACICNSISKTHPHLLRQWHPTLNGDLKSDEVSNCSNKKAWWLCENTTCQEKCQHIWEATICSRASLNTGCPHCANLKRCEHLSLSYTNPDIAKQWHPTLNAGIDIKNYHIGSSEKVWWLCPNKSTDICASSCEHKWLTAIHDRKQSGCPYCSTPRKQICEHSSIIYTHPNLVKEIHPTLNDNLDVKNISSTCDKKFWWICHKKSSDICTDACSHKWQCSVAHRALEGTGCPYCAHNHIKFCEHVTIKYTHPNVAAQWHPTKNIDLDINKVLPGCNKSVWWKCDKTCANNTCSHEWKAKVNDRTKSRTPSGCPFCSNNRLVCEHDSIKYTHPKICEEWHPTRNGAIKKEDISFGSDIKIWWQCQINISHVWETSIGHRTSGKGCPSCLNKTEGRLYDYLLKIYPKTIRQYKLDSCKLKKHLPFDFFIPDLNIIIELDGGQHFKQVRNWNAPEKATKLDIYKMRKAEKEDYKIIRISQEDVYNNDDVWLSEHLLPAIKSEARNAIFISTVDSLYDEHYKMWHEGKAWESHFGDTAKGYCFCCKKELDVFDDWCAGHIVSLSNNGTNATDNLRPVCGSCNRSMGTENMDAFKARCYPN